MFYRYTAYKLDEGIHKGKLEANSLVDARDQVFRLGYKLIDIDVLRQLPSKEDIFPTFFRVKTGDLAQFARHLAAVLASGGNLVRALEMLHQEARNPILKRTVAAIRRTLDQGGSLSDGLKEHPLVFNQLFVSVVEVGEFTGGLAPALDQMAEILEKEAEARRKAIKTLLYPVAIIMLSLITMAILMLVAMPPLLAVFERMGAKAPLMTRMIVGVFTQIQDKGLFIATGGVAFFITVSLLRKNLKVKFWMDARQLKMPIVGGLTVAGELAAFSRSVAMLLEAGVSISNALKLGISGTKNLVMKKAFLDAEESMLTGHGLTPALKLHPVLPTLFVELVMIGEESNSLPRTMRDAAKTYSQIQEQRLDNLLAMLEPISTLIVGGVVGLIAFSMFMPIYSGLQSFE
ncbi:MAG: type II secretion system F family protein [Chloroflexi bacterium]|nr:type II secretion system F family protein [Chloroflexota bacterium]